MTSGARPLRLVRQTREEVADCGIACVAMVVPAPYGKVKELFDRFGLRKEKNGEVTYYSEHRHLIRVLRRLGKKSIQKRTFTRMRSIDGQAIVKVNVRKDGHWHWIVFDGLRRKPAVLNPDRETTGVRTDFRGLKGVGKYLLVTPNPLLQSTRQKRARR